jgi:hypothetical protein
MSNINNWFSSNGDNTFSVQHELNEDSYVVDLGAYTGVWADKIIKKYNPNIILLESVPEFYNILVEKYKNNKKVHILNCGISDKNTTQKIYLDKDASSVYKKTDNFIDIKMITIEKLFEIFSLNKIDLIQINIEGEEYSLLENLADLKYTIQKINSIQVQFHDFIENCQNRRNNIQNLLIENNFIKIYDFPFVWECWRKNK